MRHEFDQDAQDAPAAAGTGGHGTRPDAVAEADLPPPGTRRWVISRKAAVVAGVRQGLLTVEDALERYALSLDEFLSWNRLFSDFGVKGLRTTRIKEYRSRGHQGRSAGESPAPVLARPSGH